MDFWEPNDTSSLGDQPDEKHPEEEQLTHSAVVGGRGEGISGGVVPEHKQM